MPRRILCILLAALLLAAGVPLAGLAGPAEDRIGDVDLAAAVALDADTGEVLFDYEADTLLPPASTAKILTALLVLEAIDRGELSASYEFTVTQEMMDGVPGDASRMSEIIKTGEVFTVEQMLCAHLISSDCYASRILACVVSGTCSAFCEKMDERSAELGFPDSHFTDPSGYPDPPMVTSAHALAVTAVACMEYELFRKIVSTVDLTLPATNLSPARYLKNTNLLLWKQLTDVYGDAHDNRYYSPWARGVKTGSSTPAGYCLVSWLEKDGRRICIAALGARSSGDSSGAMVQSDLDLPQYAETLRIFDTVTMLLDARDAVTADAEIRFASVERKALSAVEQWQDLHKRDGELTKQWHRRSVARSVLIVVILAVLFAFLLLASVAVYGRRQAAKRRRRRMQARAAEARPQNPPAERRR